MLGHDSFYHQSIRKVIIAFGSLFNGIELVKYDQESRAELGRQTVPLTYEGKETFMTRLEGDPELNKGIQTNLPVMTYEMMGLKYDPSRKQSPFLRTKFVQTGSTASSIPLASPWNMFLDVNLYVRNMEDGLQIIEQIIPFFTPDYTVKLKYLTSGNNYISYDLPITLEDLNFNNSYEGPAGSVRSITWTLNFSAKMFIFGPVAKNGKVIKDSIIHIRDYDSGNLTATIESIVSPITANVTDAYNVITTITETGA